MATQAKKEGRRDGAKVASFKTVNGTNPMATIMGLFRDLGILIGEFQNRKRYEPYGDYEKAPAVDYNAQIELFQNRKRYEPYGDSGEDLLELLKNDVRFKTVNGTNPIATCSK